MTLSVGQTARQRIDSLDELLAHHPGIGQRVYGLFVDWTHADDKLRGPRLAQRIADRECAILGGWCLTHNEEDNPGHAFNEGRLSTLD